MFTKLGKFLILVLVVAIPVILIINRKSSTQFASTHLTTETNINLYQYQEASDNLIQWIHKLEEYECRNCPLGYKRLDSNGLFSYGCLQFQMPTFKQYFTKYYPDIVKNMEEVDWENQIYDCDVQKNLAYMMIKDNWNNWRYWYYSIEIRGLDKPPLK